MNHHAVIFDLDGTLADTLEDIADNMNRTLLAFGFPTHDYATYRLLVGKGLKNLVTRSIPESERNESVIDKCHTAMVADYTRHYINKTRLYNGIPELLDELARRNVAMAVLSNKTDSITQKICGKLLRPWPFKLIMGFTDRFPRKPNPESALFTANALGALPNAVCYLGDSDVDMQTACAAGFYPIGVSWGFRPKEELWQNGAQQLIDTPQELIALL